jgi:hypothetical protein
VATDQVWTLEHEGRQHRIVAGGNAAHVVRWYVDDQLLAEKKTWDDKVVVKAADAAEGQLVVRYSGLGTPRRATIGGVDLVPEPGSRSAAYEDRVREHPTRYAAVATVGGVAKVVVPLLLSLVVIRFAIAIPWPHIDLPDPADLPSIPFPSVPLPDLPDWHLPGWLRWLLDKVKYVWPVVLAYVLARAEIRRRQDQDRERQAGREDGDAMLDG